MKKMILLGALVLFYHTSVSAKVYMHKDSTSVIHMEDDITFSNVYSKDFYKKSYFGYTVTGAVVVVAGAVSYLSVGTGAPAAATGVGATASYFGGGSYMAGLSTVGSWFGGNAMLGSAILNGVSFGVIGGTTTKFAALGILAKVGILASVTASGLDGVFYFSNPDTKKLEYKVKVGIPKDYGSKKIRKLVDKIYDINDDIQEAIEEEDEERYKGLLEKKEKYNQKAINILKSDLYIIHNPENLIVLGIIAWNNNEIDLFNEAILRVGAKESSNIGLLNYLFALRSLSLGMDKETLTYLEKSIYKNSYAIEPYILAINILGNNNFVQNESRILKLVKRANKKFDSDKYSSEFGLVPLYYRLATFYFTNKQYFKSEKFYRKAYDELGIMQKYLFGEELIHIINLGIANSLYSQGYKGSKKEAYTIYNDIIQDIDDDNDDEKKQIKSQFVGN